MEQLYGLKTAFQANDGKYGKGAIIPVGNSFLFMVHIDANSMQLANDPLNPFDAAINQATNGHQFVTWAVTDDYVTLNAERLNSPVKSWNWNGNGANIPSAQIMGTESIDKPPLPYFIQWDNSDWQSGKFMMEQTQRVQTNYAVYGIAYMELSGRHGEYYSWVGDSSVYIHWSERLLNGKTFDGIVSVALNTSKGLIILREGEIYTTNRPP